MTYADMKILTIFYLGVIVVIFTVGYFSGGRRTK